MKPQPAPNVPGKTDSERFSNAVKMILAVPAEAVTKEKKRMKRASVLRKESERSDHSPANSSDNQ